MGRVRKSSSAGWQAHRQHLGKVTHMKAMPVLWGDPNSAPVWYRDHVAIIATRSGDGFKYSIIFKEPYEPLWTGSSEREALRQAVMRSNRHTPCGGFETIGSREAFRLHDSEFAAGTEG